MSARIALVTGASRGIGRAVADALGADGHHVVRLARSAGDLVIDLRAADLGARLAEVAPQVDVLVHAATAHPPFRRAEETEDEALQHAYDLGPGAVLRLLRHALPGMKARGFGRIVLLGSRAATVGGRGQLAYATAKAALVGLARTVAAEAGPRGVTCNVVEPGLVDTERTRDAVDPAVRAAILADVPAGRAGTVEEVAGLVAFLASDAGGYVNGARLDANGGAGLGAWARRRPEP